MNKQNIGFIGCGNLALQAIKTLSGSYNIFYSNLSINQAAENLAAEKLETIDLAKKCDVIFITVKPNVTAEVLSSIASQLQNQLIISFVAGISRSKLIDLAGGYKNIVRTMPSLGIGFKNGPIAIAEMGDKALVDIDEKNAINRKLSKHEVEVERKSFSLAMLREEKLSDHEIVQTFPEAVHNKDEYVLALKGHIYFFLQYNQITFL